MTTPLHQVKAEFFKTLSHPVRIRALELLSEREHSVGELLGRIEVEPSNLSQQLAVLRRAGLVTTRQRPETAKGILFLLLEDETGMLNVVVRPELHEADRPLYRGEPLLIVRGTLEQQARRLNLTALEAWPLAESLPDAVKSAAGRRAQQAVERFEPPPVHQFR